MFTTNDSLFDNNNLFEEAEIVFVADLFVKDYSGGAELTSQALIDASPYNVTCIYAKNVTLKLLEEGQDKFWIFGNFSNLNQELLPSIIANIKYAILEYDYKYCKYRSAEKHKASENQECNCQNELQGKLVSAFFCGAKSLWWMSEAQQQHYYKIFPFLETQTQNTVLSSVLSTESLQLISKLRNDNESNKTNEWIVFGSESWIKGTQEAEKWCQEHNKKYRIIQGLTHQMFLECLSKAEGFVYLPLGGDTCPRAVIEAKLLNCKLELNDNVQHANEEWFATDDLEDIKTYLELAPQVFWKGIKENIECVPTISGYTTTKDCISQQYPFKECIKSMLDFCDEVVVVDGGSTDDTWKELQELAKNNSNLVIKQNIRDWSHPRFAVFDGEQKAHARSLCTSEFCWQMDSDEIINPEDIQKIKEIINHFPSNTMLMALPVIEYWGSLDKVRCDVNPWKWRLSRNAPNITHGIPKQLRRHDENNNLYSLPGSDGCDYIDKETHECIPFMTFYTPDVDKLRNIIHTSPAALTQYEIWFNNVAFHLPCVFHFSWFNLSRKIKTYKNYWGKHWQSLYNIEYSDAPESNMFFNKSWADVTDNDINELAGKLKNEMGGWIFHEKIDFSKPTKSIKCKRKIPQLMLQWCENNVG